MLFAFFPRMGWILQVSFYWVPLFVVLGALRKDRLFNFQERSQAALHAILTFVLFLMVKISIYPPTYVLSRPNVMIFSGLIHACILGYLCAYWFLFLCTLARKESSPAWMGHTRMVWAVLPALILLALLGCRHSVYRL